MKDFYYLRHGVTDANEYGYMCGSELDISLSEKGKAQAALGAEITLQRIRFLRTICTSPLLRARQTAGEVHARFPQASLKEVWDLREWYFGKWSRIPYKKVKEQYLGSGDPPGGETRKEFKDRVQRVLKDCLTLPDPILLIAHGGIWIMISRYLSLPFEEAPHAVPIHVYKSQGKNWNCRILKMTDS